MKRVIDFAVSVCTLVLIFPVLATVGLVVRLESPGPAIFRQVRIGRHGHAFEILKLRTMRIEGEGAAVTADHDPRITRFGRFLRSTKIDELPQLWNVVKGEMSLVGPRPEVPQYAALWTPDLYEKILSVRPGITDPASIEFRNESSLLASYDDPERAYREIVFPTKAAIYVDYVDNYSFFGDIRIIVATAAAIIKRGSND